MMKGRWWKEDDERLMWKRRKMMRLRRRMEDRSQDREAHFVWACAGDTRMDISQEPFCLEIYRQNGRGRLRGHRFARACAVEMHMDRVQEPFCMEIYRKNDRDTSGDIVLCEPAQSKRTWTFHKCTLGWGRVQGIGSRHFPCRGEWEPRYTSCHALASSEEPLQLVQVVRCWVEDIFWNDCTPSQECGAWRTQHKTWTACSWYEWNECTHSGIGKMVWRRGCERGVLIPRDGLRRAPSFGFGWCESLEKDEGCKS